MATSINVGFPIWLDGETFSGLIGRSFDVAALTYQSGSSSSTAVRGGVLPAGGASALQVAASSGMNITVNPGFCVVPNSTSSLYGGYRFGLTSQGTLTVAASDPTNGRIDLVVAQVTDNGDATSFAQFELVTGTPAPSPAAPSAPSNSITLAQIVVGAGVSTITSGNITDQRTWTVPPGGILPVSAAAAAPTGQNGAYVHDLAVGRLAHNGTAGVKQTHLLPFSPATASLTADVSSTGAETTVLSVSVTTDGSTDIEVHYKWYACRDFGSGTSAVEAVHHNLYIDATLVDVLATGVVLASNSLGGPGGGSGYYRTMGSLGTTPSAGTHTIAWKFTPVNNSGDSVHIQASSTTPALLVVKPVCL